MDDCKLVTVPPVAAKSDRPKINQRPGVRRTLTRFTGVAVVRAAGADGPAEAPSPNWPAVGAEPEVVVTVFESTVRPSVREVVAMLTLEAVPSGALRIWSPKGVTAGLISTAQVLASSRIDTCDEAFSAPLIPNRTNLPASAAPVLPEEAELSIVTAARVVPRWRIFQTFALVRLL